MHPAVIVKLGGIEKHTRKSIKGGTRPFWE